MTEKKKYLLALKPNVQKALRRLAVEYDTYPGDVVAALLEFSEMVLDADEPVSKRTIEALYNACMRTAEKDRVVEESELARYRKKKPE